MSVYAQDYGYFFNSNNSDRTYNADSFETWLKPFFVSGVFTGCLQVKAQSTPDMTVQVTKGYANLDGKAAYWPDDNTVTIETASGVYSRIDTIVLRRDNTNRRVSIEVVKGTASATPQPVAPTRNADTFELVLAEVLVGVGVTEITGSVITDKRPDTDVCGYVVAAVQTPDFSDLYDQFVAQAEEFMGDQADEFIAWFDEMKDQLSEDAAGHLQLEIDGKIDKVMSYFSPGEFPMLQSGGGLTGSGVKETSFASAASISAKNYTNLTNVPTNLSCGDVYVRNGEAFVVINANGIASGTAFSSLTSSDIAEMKLADEIASLNSNCPEIVTNANGTALKFPTGLMICYKNVSKTISMTTSWGSLYEGSIALGDWPVEFTDVPTCTCANNTGAGGMLESWNDLSKSSAGTAFFARGNSSANVQLKIGVTAYGKWK